MIHESITWRKSVLHDSWLMACKYDHNLSFLLRKKSIKNTDVYSPAWSVSLNNGKKLFPAEAAAAAVTLFFPPNKGLLSNLDPHIGADLSKLSKTEVSRSTQLNLNLELDPGNYISQGRVQQRQEWATWNSWGEVICNCNCVCVCREGALYYKDMKVQNTELKFLSIIYLN